MHTNNRYLICGENYGATVIRYHRCIQPLDPHESHLIHSLTWIQWPDAMTGPLICASQFIILYLNYMGPIWRRGPAQTDSACACLVILHGSEGILDSQQSKSEPTVLTVEIRKEPVPHKTWKMPRQRKFWKISSAYFIY